MQRYRGDPVGALENCDRLRKTYKERTAEELKVRWTTTFAFLHRIGLDKYAFDLEDAGFKVWHDLRTLSKDDLKAKGNMSDADAVVCHAVLDGNAERPDLLRLYQSPEFGDIQTLFQARFPDASEADARRFALELTDELGVCDFSCFQISNYLAEVKGGPAQAMRGLKEGLPTLDEAEAARKRPEPPPPAEDPTDWVHVWLKEAGLADLSGHFLDQKLSTRDDILGAPIDDATLKELGMNKLGHRCKVLRMIAEERKKDS